MRPALLLLFAVRLTYADLVVLTFDDLPVSPPVAFVGAQVGDQYASKGVHFSLTDWGVVDAPGNWGLVGTNGRDFDGFNGRSGSGMRLTFDTGVSNFSMDFAAGDGGLPGTLVIQAVGAAGIQTQTIPFGAFNQWQTVTFDEQGITSVLFHVDVQGNPIYFDYGVDNIRFETPVPEPSALILLCSAALGLIFSRLRRASIRSS